MSLKLQIFIGIIVVIMLGLIVNMVRQKKIDLRYALSWIGLGIIILILDIFPIIVFSFAEFIDISVPSNMVFLVGFMIAIVMIFLLTVSVSRLSTKSKRMVQEIALLREEVEKVSREKNDNKE